MPPQWHLRNEIVTRRSSLIAGILDLGVIEPAVETRQLSKKLLVLYNMETTSDGGFMLGYRGNDNPSRGIIFLDQY